MSLIIFSRQARRLKKSKTERKRGKALRAQLAADATSSTAEHKPLAMLDFGAEWGRGVSGPEEDEQMGNTENKPEKFVVDEEGVIDLTG